MKVILSRKGFDSANGGIVSPIFEDGTMISFPIPCETDCDTYSDLVYREKSYSEILKDLHYKGDVYNCHVDPDLDMQRRKEKIDGWFPAFGQINASASYLIKNIRVAPKDLFLFFGNFHYVEDVGGSYQYMRNSGDFYRDSDLQVIWGYLQVGEIITKPDEQQAMAWHPHSQDYRTKNQTNVIFKAAEKLSFDESKCGAGLLTFDKKRVLTLEGASKATWKMNKVYDVDHINGKRKNRAKDPNKGIYYSGIWQELGLEESKECFFWAKNIVL